MPDNDAGDALVESEFYFSIVPEFVVDCGKPRAIQVYAILARYADREGTAFPGRPLIAERAQCSIDTVDRALRELEALKAIEVQRTKKPDGSYERNVYTLLQRLVGAVGGGRTVAGGGSRNGAGGVTAPTRTQLETTNESQVNDIASAAQNAWWDALEAVFGYRPIGPEKALWGRLVKHIAEAGDSPDEIARRAALWLVGPVWEGRQAPPRLTPAALLKHWQWLGSKVASATGAELSSWRAEYKRGERERNIEGGTQ